PPLPPLYAPTHGGAYSEKGTWFTPGLHWKPPRVTPSPTATLAIGALAAPPAAVFPAATGPEPPPPAVATPPDPPPATPAPAPLAALASAAPPATPAAPPAAPAPPV